MIPRAQSVRTFHLVDADGSPPDRVVVPDGLSRFLPRTGDTPARCAPARSGRPGGSVSCLVEPVDLGQAPALLVLAADERPFRVNGRRSARIATLLERDQLQLDGGETYHVALHTRCAIGLAPEERRHEPCAVCHQPLGMHAVYLCASCAAAVHSDQGTGDGEPLNCLDILSECPRCRAPLVREGYARHPGDPT